MSACLANVGDDKYYLMFYVTKITQTKNTCAICDWKAYLHLALIRFNINFVSDVKKCNLILTL